MSTPAPLPKDDDLNDLEHLEGIIDGCLDNCHKAVMKIGQVLQEIQTRELYKKRDFATFESYCRERFDISRQHAYRWVRAKNIYDVLEENNIRNIKKERQLRALDGLSNAEIVDVAREAVVAYGEPTSSQIAEKRYPYDIEKEAKSRKSLSPVGDTGFIGNILTDEMTIEEKINTRNRYFEASFNRRALQRKAEEFGTTLLKLIKDFVVQSANSLTSKERAQFSLWLEKQLGKWKRRIPDK